MTDLKCGCQKTNYKQEIYYYFCYIKKAFDICYGFKKEITISFDKMTYDKQDNIAIFER